MDGQEYILPNEVDFFVRSKLAYLFHKQGYGEVRIKVQEGLPATQHFTESFRIKKRVRKNDTR